MNPSTGQCGSKGHNPRACIASKTEAEIGLRSGACISKVSEESAYAADSRIIDVTAGSVCNRAKVSIVRNIPINWRVEPLVVEEQAINR